MARREKGRVLVLDGAQGGDGDVPAFAKATADGPAGSLTKAGLPAEASAKAGKNVYFCTRKKTS